MADNDNPTVLARETLKLLAARRIAPTPVNYQRIYHEIAGQPAIEPAAPDKFAAIARQLAARHPGDAQVRALSAALDRGDMEGMAVGLQGLAARPPKASANELSLAFREAVRQLDIPHRGWPVGRKRESLDRVLSASVADSQLAARLQGLTKSWQDGGNAGAVDPDRSVSGPGGRPATREGETVPATFDPALRTARELLASTLENGVGPRIERYSDIYAELFQLSWKVREVELEDDWNRLAAQLKQFWLKVELRVEPDEELIDNLMRLLGLVVDNLDELVDDDQWIQGQVAVLRELISKPVDLRAVREAERGFKEVIYKQSHLKASLADAKQTLKSLLSVFIERLGEVTGHTVDYHEKIGHYAERIAATDSIDSLRALVEELMAETRGMQVDMMRSRDELVSAREQAEAAESRVRQLESELERVSEQVREDQLTGTLNRRGMDDALEREIARADRSGKAMCISVLDLDNFKRLNDTYGHAAGDAALVHLAKVIRHTVRPTDVIARYGGEEFLIILAGTSIDEAVGITTRLQRELTRRFFLHNNERLLITFSAGVAEYRQGESEESFFARADQAMYRGKEQGKNQVVPAE